MLIEIVGTNSHNKGAELMLYAVAAQREAALAGHRMAVPPGEVATATIAKLGLEVVYRDLRPAVRHLLAPRNWRHPLRAPSAVSGVLDASGFHYSDQWGAEYTERAAKRFAAWRRAGRKMVLLPQAFGPFETQRIRTAMTEIARNVDLIYARDSVSRKHLEDAGCDPSILRTAADITIPLARTSVAVPLAERDVAIVPNARMVDMTSGDIAQQYVRFLERTVRHLLQHGIAPRFVLHETRGDLALVAHLEREIGQKFAVVDEPDPIRLKQILAGARFAISSRYHAIISALSQGVPCIATGWSHKYETLYADFGVPELMVSRLDDETESAALLERMMDASQAALVSAQLLARAAELTAGIDRMWSEVAGVMSPS